MPRAIVLLELETRIGLKVFTNLRNNSLRIRDLIDASPALFLKYSNTFAMSSTYTTPKHPSNLPLVSVNYIVRMINLRGSNLPYDPFFCILS